MDPEKALVAHFNHCKCSTAFFFNHLAATNVTGFSETLSLAKNSLSLARKMKILEFSEKFLEFNRKILEFREKWLILDLKNCIYLKKTEKMCASRWYRNILSLIIVKIFRKLEFRTKFCLSLAKNVEKKAGLVRFIIVSSKLD